jgi:transposase
MPRVEIFTGAERRRRWPDADKLAVLEEASAPGVSAASVARRHDLFPQQIYRWRHQFGFGRHKASGDEGCAATKTPVSFLTLEVVPSENGEGRSTSAPVPPPSSSSRLECGDDLAEIVLTNGRRLRICPAIGEASLVRLIRILETA